MAFFDNIKYLFCRLLTRKPSATKGLKAHKRASYGNGAKLINCEIGRYSYIYDSTAINTKIGSFCSIASDCIIGGGFHPTNWVSSSPVFYKGKNVFKKHFSQNEFTEHYNTEIGNDVWIGSRCLIKSGVKIGDGAIIGMGSVVTHDIPPYEIWGGTPARFIRKRFDDDTIKKLLELKWWNLNDKELEKYGDAFNNPKTLFELLKETEE